LGMQGNFKTAVSELMNGKLFTETEAEKPDEDTATAPEPFGLGSADVSFGSTSTNDSIAKARTGSLIAEDMVIEGSVRSESPIQVNGKVRGNVTSARDIISRGAIEGDIKGGSITLIKSSVKGNLAAGNFLSMDADSMVVGNIDATGVEINGKIKGDVRVSENATLRKAAVILGNLTAKSLSIEAGAAIKGKMEILPAPIQEKDFKALEGKSSDNVRDSFIDIEEENKEI
jgi:cytoskeletal protein CcmA (bactofilin family)